MSVEVIVSPMQGIISSLFVGVGDEVSAGDVLYMIEVMKMLTPIESNVKGKVTEIYALETKTVARGEKLLAIEC